QGGAGAVRLQVADGAGVDARRAHRVDDDLRLGLRVRGGERGRAAPVVDGTAEDHGPDRVAVLQGAVQRLEDDGADALAADVAGGGVVGGGAPAACAGHACRGERVEECGAQGQVLDAADGQVAVAVPQCTQGVVHGDERT